MTLPGKVIEASDGMRGFDANSFISTKTAAGFRAAGFRFCIRYVPRHEANPHDISGSEAAGILSMGLGLMLVQHVHPDSETRGWLPTGALGTEYGAFAAKSAVAVGYRTGAMLWCDLEGVRLGIDPRDVIAFCNNWHHEVASAGFTPGLYVGFNAGLTGSQLYYKLKFEHYWSAYNLNADRFPAVRGVQMRQGVEKILGGIRYDPDIVHPDLKGGLPLMLVDNEWTAL